VCVCECKTIHTMTHFRAVAFSKHDVIVNVCVQYVHVCMCYE